ncbi:MAG TPA: YhjD/YihY/BrkB family envelope integrity protein [Pseudonocardiaceae bacterium]
MARLVRAIAAGMAERLRGRDLSLAAAGLTFYAGIAVVPCLLLALWLVGPLLPTGSITSAADDLVAVLPPRSGAAVVVRGLVDAGAGLGPLGAAIALLPATFYGEGLRRAFLRFTHRRESFVGWRGRLLVVPLLAAAPALVLPLLLAARLLGRVTGIADVLIGFTVVWLVLWAVLGWTFRVIAPSRPAGRAVLAGAMLTAACLAGFLQGFVLFLSLPLDLGAPFGGLTVVGGVVAVGLWLFVLHVVVLVGWTFTLARAGRWRG